MNINHHWLKEGHIAFFEIEGDISWDDLEEMNTTIVEYLETEGAHEVHCVFTTDKVKTHPINIFKINRAINFQKHSRLGWIFLVTENSALNFISSATSQVTNTKQKTVSSLDELYKIMSRLNISVDASQS